MYVIGGNESRRQGTWLCTFQTFLLVHLAVFGTVWYRKANEENVFNWFKEIHLNKRSGANDV